MRLILAPLLTAAAALSACGKPAPDAAPRATAQPAVPGVAAPDRPAPPVNTALPRAAPDTLSPDGFEGVRPGRTIAQIEAAGHKVTLSDPPMDDESACRYATIAGLAGLSVMFEDGRLARFDVTDRTDDPAARARAWQSPEGARIGSSEAELKRLYGDRLAIEQHPYTGPEGHYAVVHAPGATTGTIFETDGTRVLTWRAGAWNPVQYIEGCL